MRMFSPNGNDSSECEIIIVGSGIAGLVAAIKCSPFARVSIFCKGALHETNTWLAQGGIAAAVGEDDSPEQHLQDTLQAGAGMCSYNAVEIMVKEAPRRIGELVNMGTPFDPGEKGFALTMEGAHTRNRILHAGGDATGKLIQETLIENVTANKNVTIHEHTFVTELLLGDSGLCGIKTVTGQIFRSGVVILATGGMGRVYSRTTNPEPATGDGVAMAFRAGAEIMDMEFVQFHPTVFLGEQEKDTFLISEAVRGEGALLRSCSGERFMDSYSEMAELGPRDIVSRAIVDQMQKTGSSYVCLDITHKSAAFLKKRFPTIYRMAEERGYDLSRDWLPVSPAAHYTMGGVRTGLHGETNIAGLYVCGEAACTGVHGANRLASNSLLEGLVFASRAAEHIGKKGVGPPPLQCADAGGISNARLPVRELQSHLRRLMFQKAGILRSEEDLGCVASFLENESPPVKRAAGTRAVWELKNLFTAADLIVKSALKRKESRGSHYRIDYPASEPSWERRLCWKLQENGEVTCRSLPL